jgi:membrane protein involved in colicin uptake
MEIKRFIRPNAKVLTMMRSHAQNYIKQGMQQTQALLEAERRQAEAERQCVKAELKKAQEQAIKSAKLMKSAEVSFHEITKTTGLLEQEIELL